jgi:hypothetical protein
MRLVVEMNRPIQVDDRYGVPGVPGAPAPYNTGEGEKVPEILYPVVLKTEERGLNIGVVGKERGMWAWYALIDNVENYLPPKYRTPQEAARDILWLASGYKPRRVAEGCYPGLRVQVLQA